MAYYRIYRPQTIADLDSAKLRETLTALLSRKDVPHAFLFTGPKGLGKTSTARIIAKSVNCERRSGSKIPDHVGNDNKDSIASLQNDKKEEIAGKITSSRNDMSLIEPCNACETCISITNGSNIDVLEIDGASNRGIDEIRDLREKVKLAPAHAKKKVYIIDEVHMLTTEAFNALLKTIEEPPSHVMFIFCTTEPQKVPGTIMSRCFHIALLKATQEEIVHSLKRIVAGEKIVITDEALGFIAEMADGGFRDAAKILEETVALGGEKTIDKAFIEKHNNTTGVTLEVDALLTALKTKNAVACLAKIAVMIDQGMSIKYFIERILLRFHEMLLNTNGMGAKPTNSPEFSLAEISILVELFFQAHQQTKYAVIAQLPLELAVVVWCESEKTVSSESVASVPLNDRVTLDVMIKKEKNLKVQQILKPDTKKPEPKITPTTKQEDMNKDHASTAHMLENIIYKVKPQNHSLAGLLRSCTVTRVDGDDITIQTAYKFHKEKIMESQNIGMLIKAFKELTGKDVRVVVELKE